MPFLNYVLIGLGALAAGVVNALAGGGTLITFPLLSLLGIPAVSANITNTIALCPGYFGAMAAQRSDLALQKNRVAWLIPAGLLGGLGGALLLLVSEERLFQQLVPWLILFSCVLLALGDPLKSWLASRPSGQSKPINHKLAAILPVGLATVYGGYFGAGLSVIILAVLGLFFDDSLTRLNALKQALAFAANVSAAIVFLFSGRVIWPVAVVMAGCALAGGFIGGRFAKKINPSLLRWLVVGIGATVSVIYFIK